jgi:hypothetical protein
MTIGVYKRTQKEVSQFSKMSILVYDLFSTEQILSKFWSKYINGHIGIFAKDEEWLSIPQRSIKKDYFVFLMTSPIYGCSMKLITNEQAGKIIFPHSKPKGFYDPCSNISFDLAGRIYINNKFKHHMFIPNHRYINDETIEFYPIDDN